MSTEHEIVLDFDATTVAPKQGGGGRIIPKGKYSAAVEQWKTFTNDDGSTVLQTSFKITEGEFSGKWIREKYMVKSGNPDHEKRVKAARGRIASLLVACGMPQERVVSRTEGCPVVIDVGVLPASGNYEEKNVINGVFAPSALPAPASAPAASKPFLQKRTPQLA